MRVIRIDKLDYFLSGLCIACYLTRKYFPTIMEKEEEEKKKLIRLAWSLMRKSRIKLKRKKKQFEALQAYEMRFLKLRGGDFTYDQIKEIIKAARQTQVGELVAEIYQKLRKQYNDQEYQLALKLREIVLQILYQLKYKEFMANVVQDFRKRFFYSQVSSLLCAILSLFHIHITYRMYESMDLGPKAILISVMAGATTGFAASWVPFLRVLVGTNLAASGLLLKSLVQQSVESIQYLHDRAQKRKLQKLLDNFYSSDRIVGPALELESNAAEVFSKDFKMPTFEKTPVGNESFELNPTVKDLFEELSVPDPLKDVVGRTPMNQRPRPPKRKWGKMVRFSDFIRENEIQEGLEVINEQIK